MPDPQTQSQTKPEHVSLEQLIEKIGVKIDEKVKESVAPMFETQRKNLSDLVDERKRENDKLGADSRGIKMARTVKSAIVAEQSKGQFNHQEAARQLYPGDETLHSALDPKATWRKALAESVGTAGGYAVPPEFYPELIELLYDITVVRRAGARLAPMNTNTLLIPRLQAGATATYVGENANAPSSQQTLNQLQLTARKLMVLVPISNDLIRDSTPAADRWVRDDIVQVAAVREDLAFIRGDGTVNTPLGILNATNAANIFTANTGTNPTLANVMADLRKVVANVERGRKLQMVKPGWLFSVRTKNYLYTLQTTTGAFIFRDEMNQGKLLGYPYYATTAIPENLTVTSTDSSELYFGDFTDFIIGENMAAEIEASREAAYFDTVSGQVIAAFSADQTVVRLIMRHDTGERHDKSFSIAQGVEWT